MAVIWNGHEGQRAFPGLEGLHKSKRMHPSQSTQITNGRDELRQRWLESAAPVQPRSRADANNPSTQLDRKSHPPFQPL